MGGSNDLRVLLHFKSVLIQGPSMLLLLGHFSHVQLCATPWTAAHQAPSSLGFSRQEHWSGLPFPSPMHESEKWKEVAQSCPTLSDPMDCNPPGSSVHRIFQARVLEWGAIAFSKDLAYLLLNTSPKYPCTCTLGNMHKNTHSSPVGISRKKLIKSITNKNLNGKMKNTLWYIHILKYLQEWKKMYYS